MLTELKILHTNAVLKKRVFQETLTFHLKRQTFKKKTTNKKILRLHFLSPRLAEWSDAQYTSAIIVTTDAL